ncbi:MAG: glycosyltransferase [Flammeovirgaceae bacterium]
MKILILTYQGDVAGSTYSISYLAHYLAERGHQIFVGCPQERLLYKLFQNTKVKLIDIPFKSKFDINSILKIKEIVEKENIEIINAQSSYDRYASILSKWMYDLDAKIYHTRRQISKSMGGFIQNWFYTKGTDKIIAVSNEVKKSLVKSGLKDSHIKVIPNGTPLEKYKKIQVSETEKLRKKYDIKSGDFVIGCVSRYKRQYQILEALLRIKKPVKLFLIGVKEDDFQKSLLENVKKCNHQIIFESHIDQEKVLSYYPLFDIKILASTIEGLSQSLLEAMAIGIPVIATAAAGNLDLIENGKSGLLFDDGNVEELARNINYIRNNDFLKRKLVIEGRRTALEEYSIEKTIDLYEQFFLEELNKR